MATASIPTKRKKMGHKTASPSQNTHLSNTPNSEVVSDEPEPIELGNSRMPRSKRTPGRTIRQPVDVSNPQHRVTKKARTAKSGKPIVYDIQPVETKKTTFKGRLGYACVNTILREFKPNPIFCSRTCRLDTILKNGIGHAQSLGLQNVLDLTKMIQWNEENMIRFMRISSELFPFASHDKYGYEIDFAVKELKAAGDLAKRFGHRLTAHPGQFTQLASPREEVVRASLRDLSYHNRVMELMGLGSDSVIVIHMGGKYGDKSSTLARFKDNYNTKVSPQLKARLVLENDEMCYNIDDLMPVSEELNIPIVVDYHHDWINPSTRPLSELIPIINKIWARKSIRPKQHLSSPRPGAVTVTEKRAHSDRCNILPEDLPDDMDLMVEAKDKEQAVFHLYRIYNLEPVILENLRPERPFSPPPDGKRGQSSKIKDEALDLNGNHGERLSVALKKCQRMEDVRAVRSTSALKKRKRNTRGQRSEKRVISDLDSASKA